MPFASMCYDGPAVFARDVENQLRLRLLRGDRISNRITLAVWRTAVLIIQGGLALFAQTVTHGFTTVRTVKSSTVD
jgi:hypothetical protein